VPIFSKGRLVAASSLILFASAMSMDEAEKLYVPSLISMAKAISEKLSAADSENKEGAENKEA
jgi:DNA-binding IclR family transcriptional regulator